MNSIWFKIANTLDRKFYNIFDAFWKDMGTREYSNNLILEIYSSRLLDYLAVHYLPVLMALSENEFFLLLVVTHLLSVSISPYTRENINGINLKKEKMSFSTLFEKMMQSETRKEYSNLLNRKYGFKMISGLFRDYMGEDTEEEEGPIVIGGKTDYSEEECYRDYCALVRRMLAEDDDTVFLKLYKYYHEIREKIEQGMYPRWYSTGSDDIKLDLNSSFITDSSVCRHFRLSCMLGRQEEEETVVLKWPDVLKYPSIYEILVEKRAVGLQSDETSDNYYLSRKMDMLNAIWISDYRILQEYRVRSEQRLEKYHYEDLSTAWKEKGKMLSAHMNLSSVQERYDKYLEGEARIAIIACMASLDELLSGHQQIKDAGELARVGEMVEEFCSSKYADLIETDELEDVEESCSELYMELWPKNDFYRQIGISDNDSYLQRYCFSDYLLDAYGDSTEEATVDYHIRQIFEEQLSIDVNKIMKFWLNHNLTLTKKIICDL